MKYKHRVMLSLLCVKSLPGMLFPVREERRYGRFMWLHGLLLPEQKLHLWLRREVRLTPRSF